MDHAPAAESRLESEPPRPARLYNDDSDLQDRWWFASSAFPMIAGTLGPVASAFSICALGRHWRQHVLPNTDMGDAVFVPDPPWLTIVNAVQLAVAIVSNACLLLNMARRIRFTIAQPVTIAGWYISAICLLTLNATAAGPLLKGLERPVDEYVWSQAYYYGIWAAILYFVDASLMAVTFWGASTGRYDKEFNLTPSQRTLMLQTIMFLMYLLLGALVFSTIEGWSYLDAVYWADVTLFTVGFGDYHPSTTLGRALLWPYALVGIISLGLVVTSIRSMILERGKRLLDARMKEKKRRKRIRSMTLKGEDGILTPLQPEPTEQDSVSPDEFDRRRSEFELMRKIQQEASSRRRWLAMAHSTGFFLVLWLVGALVFFKCEKHQAWTYFDGVYFCFVSLTTIGYGDRTPHSNAGKSFFVFWSLLALPTMTILISNAGDTVVKFVRDATIHVGNMTILPGDDSFAVDAKYVAHRLTCGQGFRGAVAKKVLCNHERRGHTREKSTSGTLTSRTPVATGTSAPSTSAPRREMLQGGGHHTHHGHHGHHNHDVSTSTRGRHSLSRVRHRLDSLPTGHDFCLLLLSEIKAVSKHLRESPPRRYSFEEWAWYLGLMGEDERDPGTHRKVKPKEKHKHKHKHKHKLKQHGRRQQEQEQQQQQERPEASEPAEEPERFKWSWVGNRNPLMVNQEESEWIVERLMDRLNETLWKAKDRHEDPATDAA